MITPWIGSSIRTAASASGAQRSSTSSSPAHKKLSTVRSVKQPGRSPTGISPSRKIEELMGLQVATLILPFAFLNDNLTFILFITCIVVKNGQSIAGLVEAASFSDTQGTRFQVRTSLDLHKYILLL